MPTVIKLSPDMKLGDIPSKKGRKYLCLMRGPITFVACADTLAELDMVLQQKNITFDPKQTALFEMPGDTDMQYVVEQIGSQLDVIFGMKGERYQWHGPS